MYSGGSQTGPMGQARTELGWRVHRNVSFSWRNASGCRHRCHPPGPRSGSAPWLAAWPVEPIRQAVAVVPGLRGQLLDHPSPVVGTRPDSGLPTSGRLDTAQAEPVVPTDRVLPAVPHSTACGVHRYEPCRAGRDNGLRPHPVRGSSSLVSALALRSSRRVGATRRWRWGDRHVDGEAHPDLTTEW